MSLDPALLVPCKIKDLIMFLSTSKMFKYLALKCTQLHTLYVHCISRRKVLVKSKGLTRGKVFMLENLRTI